MPLGQAEAARPSGSDFGGGDAQVVLPRRSARRCHRWPASRSPCPRTPRWPPVFGVAEADGRMRGFTNDRPDPAERDLPLPSRPATSSSWRSSPSSPTGSSVAGGWPDMSQPAASCSTPPGRQTGRPAPGLHRRRRHRPRRRRWPTSCGGCTTNGPARVRHLGAVRHPEYIEALLVDGLLQTLKMAFTAILAPSCSA